jgi:hypothetical protein
MGFNSGFKELKLSHLNSYYHTIMIFVVLNIKNELKVCKSMHHHTIQINHQLDATISPVYYPEVIYSSTCFGYPHTHRHKLNTCSSSLWFYLHIVVIAVLLFVVGLAR